MVQKGTETNREEAGRRALKNVHNEALRSGTSRVPLSLDALWTAPLTASLGYSESPGPGCISVQSQAKTNLQPGS